MATIDPPANMTAILASLNEAEARALLRRLFVTGRAVPALKPMDPAMMTGAVVTITDLTVFFLFLGLATLVLNRLS